MVEKQYWIIDIEDETRERLTDFFESYMEIGKGFFKKEHHHVLTDEGIKTCSEFLLANGVFETINELRKQIYIEQGVFMPKL